MLVSELSWAHNPVNAEKLATRVGDAFQQCIEKCIQEMEKQGGGKKKEGK